MSSVPRLSTIKIDGQNVQKYFELAMEAELQVAEQNLRIQTISADHRSARHDLEHVQSEHSGLKGKVEALQSGLKSLRIERMALNTLEHVGERLQVDLKNLGRQITRLEKEIACKETIQRIADRAMTAQKPEEIHALKNKIAVVQKRSGALSCALVLHILGVQSTLDARLAALKIKRSATPATGGGSAFATDARPHLARLPARHSGSSRTLVTRQDARRYAHLPPAEALRLIARLPRSGSLAPAPRTSSSSTQRSRPVQDRSSVSSKARIVSQRSMVSSSRSSRGYSISRSTTYHEASSGASDTESDRGSDTESESATKHAVARTVSNSDSLSLNQVLSYVNTGLDVFDAARITAVGITAGPLAALPLVAYAASSRLVGYLAGEAASSVSSHLSKEQLAFASRISTVASIYSTVSRTSGVLSYARDWASDAPYVNCSSKSHERPDKSDDSSTKIEYDIGKDRRGEHAEGSVKHRGDGWEVEGYGRADRRPDGSIETSGGIRGTIDIK